MLVYRRNVAKESMPRPLSWTILGVLVLSLFILPLTAKAGNVHGQVYGSVTFGGNGSHIPPGGVVIHPTAPIVYPNGVLTVFPSGTTGNPVYVQGAYADPRTCYTACFHVPRGQRYGNHGGTNVRVWGSVSVTR